MKKTFFLPVLLLISVYSSADENSSFKEKEIKFIRELYNGGRYFDCIAEAEKLHLYKKTPAQEYFIYSNYYLAEQYATVINNYTPDLSSDEMQFQSLLLISGSFFKKGLYHESYKILKEQEYAELPDKRVFTMFLRRVDALILAGEMDAIDLEIAGSGIFLEDFYDFTKLRNELQLYKKENLKSPTCAAMMSAIVPGLGQCYAGYPLEGLISILSVAATVAGGVYMKENGKKSISYTMFFFSGLFYAGNVYGAYNSAEAGNNEVLRSRHRSIESQYGSYNPGDYIEIERVFN